MTCNVTSSRGRHNRVRQLDVNEACLEVVYGAMMGGHGAPDQTVTVWAQSQECDQCSFWKYMTLHRGQSASMVVNTSFPTIIRLSEDNDWWHAEKIVTYHFTEHGQYQCLFETPKQATIDIVVQPGDPYLPVLYAFLALLLLSLLYLVLRRIYRSPLAQSFLVLLVPVTSTFHQDLGQPSASTDAASSGATPRDPIDFAAERLRRRVRSLDAFRGLSVAAMLFVNYGGGKFWFFAHSAWNGLTVADLVFPWFLWISGVSIVVATQNRLRRRMSRIRLALQVLRRAAILFALGVIINCAHGKDDVTHMRVMGVLQRIGISYAVVAILEVMRLQAEDPYMYMWWAPVRDLVSSWFQWAVILTLVAIHIIVTFLLDVPGCGKGYLGPGGLHMYTGYPNCTGGASGYVDRLVLGLLGTLTAAFTMYLGVHAGRIMTTFPDAWARMRRWGAWGLILGVVAGALCGYTQNQGVIPINKNLWSVSFAMALSSLAFIMLALLYYIIDVKRYWSGAPFAFAGMNALTVYVGSEFTKRTFPWTWQPLPPTHLAFLAQHIWATALWILISYIMYRKRLFITV